MLTQKQWKIQLIAEHISNIATAAATATGNLYLQRHPMVKEHAVIADEAKKLSEQIITALEQNIYANLPESEFDVIMLDLSRRTGFLALNAALLSSKMREQISLACVADELRDDSVKLDEVFGRYPKYADIPAVMPRSSVLAETLCLFTSISGNYTWYENAHFVQEILNYCPEYIENNRLIINNSWRDLDAPVIQLGDIPKNAGLVIISDAYDPQKHYAVVVEFGVHSLIRSHAGVNKPCALDIPVRECWSASDGSDIIFLDWSKLSI